MLDRFKTHVFVAAAGLVLAAPSLGHADAVKDLQVAGRALAFLENGPSGRTTVAVVFDPAKPASVAEKNAVMAALGGGYSAGALTLVGKPVEVGSLSGVGDVGALFVTTGVNQGAVASVAKSKKIVTIGSDLSCVQSGNCVMGVATEPKVEIVVNRAAASAAGASFKAAFRMMIREI